MLSTPRGSGRSARIRISGLSGPNAFLEIIRAAFNLLVLESGRFANQFAMADGLTAGVSVRRLAYPRTLSALPLVCDALLADLHPAVQVHRRTESGDAPGWQGATTEDTGSI